MEPLTQQRSPEEQARIDIVAQEIAQLRAKTGNLLNANQVANVLDITVRTLWRWVSTGQFPHPISLSPRIKRWRSSQVDAHLEHKLRGVTQ